MNRIVRLIAVGAIPVLLAGAAPAAAQDSFLLLQDALRPGDTVFVIDDTGTETRGKVAAVGPSALRLAVKGAEREWPEISIRRVSRRDSVKNGLMIGLVTGSVTGGVGGLALASLLVNEGHDPVGPLLFLLGVGAFGGAGIGAGIDALIPGRTPIYQQRPRSVTVVPRITPRSQAIQFNVTF